MRAWLADDVFVPRWLVLMFYALAILGLPAAIEKIAGWLA